MIRRKQIVIVKTQRPIFKRLVQTRTIPQHKRARSQNPELENNKKIFEIKNIARS